MISLCLSSGCATWPRSWGTQPCCIHAKPRVPKVSVTWHLIDVTVEDAIERTFDLVRLGRRLIGHPTRSWNLRQGAVGDTAFFTNRDLAHLRPEEVRWGPTDPPRLPQPPLTVTKPKTEGKTPGLFVTDAAGARYLLKFDPVDAPELLSGAEVVTSKLLWALGYHVPSYEVVRLRPKELVVRPEFTEQDRDALVRDRLRDGTVRVSASRIVDGEILGPASFKKFRDCADVRALQVAYAWVNNIDAKDHNTLLVWDGTNTVGYVFDFGTSLGADAGLAGPQQPCAGWTNLVDLQVASLKLLTLGIYNPPCAVGERPFSPSVGFFSTRVDPRRWKPYAPNLAFDELTNDEARWMAGRIGRLSRAHLEAAVSAGQYRHAEDAARIVEVLLARRDAILAAYHLPLLPGAPSRRPVESLPGLPIPKGVP